MKLVRTCWAVDLHERAATQQITTAYRLLPCSFIRISFLELECFGSPSLQGGPDDPTCLGTTSSPQSHASTDLGSDVNASRSRYSGRSRVITSAMAAATSEVLTTAEFPLEIAASAALRVGLGWRSESFPVPGRGGGMARWFVSAKCGRTAVSVPEDDHFLCCHLAHRPWNPADPVA